jgi:hypothetical protein
MDSRCVGISLNGYLLKGIAFGVVGGRLAESLGVGFGKGSVKLGLKRRRR